MAAAPSQRQPRRGLAVAALAAAALAVGLAAALTAGSSHPRPAPTFAGVSTTSHSRSAPRHAVRKRAGTRQRHSPSSPATTPRPTATTPRPTASSLEARGHQLMDEGSYQAAIAVLRRAVAAAAPDSLTYDYALFDLGRSLRLAGDPRDAIPILWRRMQIPNQTAVVREELQLALQALGQSVQQSWGSAGPSASRPHDHGNGPPGGQQGGDQGD